MKKIESLGWGIIFISYLLALALYPFMPETMATHWNASGEVDGYMSKFFGLFLMPNLSLFMLGLFLLLPQIDPLKENVAKFRKYYDRFIVFLLLFLFYIYILALAWNLGIGFNMTRMILPAFGLLFYFMGVLMENAKRNWFIGIRTPWTLSSDRVWDKTHRAGARLFKVAGLLAFGGVFLENYAMYLVFVPIVFVSVYVMVYSYWEYRKETRVKSKLNK